jgi:hypothetical protein
MAHAFKTISAKPTFGSLQEKLYQSDYINRKKGIIVFCKTPCICKNIRVAPSYDIKNSFNIGLRFNRLNSIHNNKSNLIISQYTKENLKNVCTVSPLNPYTAPSYCSNSDPCDPCQNNGPVIIDPLNSINTFYSGYIMDPLGQLFGKSQCGELNYTEYQNI